MSNTKDTKIQLNYFVPTPVWEMFQKRVRDYRFRGVGSVVYYLLEAYRRSVSGEKVSLLVNNILKNKSESWFSLFRYDQRSQSIIVVDRSWADEIAFIADTSGYKDRSRLIAVLIGCFVSSSPTTLRKLSAEMDNRPVNIASGVETISTYVSFYQYTFLAMLAKNQQIGISKLLCTSLDVIIAAEKEDSEEYYVQGYLRDMISDVLEIKGYTTKDFRREKAIHVSISGEYRRMQILQIMKNHAIPTPREFLRRLVLFFLNAQYILFNKDVTSLAELDFSEEEDTLYDDYVKRDLRYEYYKKQAQA